MLEEEGGEFQHVLKMNVFVLDIRDYPATNQIREEFFAGIGPPASTLVEVSKFVRPDVRVEIECIAAISGTMNDKLQNAPIMREVSLSDKFDRTEGAIFITGKQALSRVPLLQRELDNRRGLRTAGYISGYRGSPLGTLDNELLKIADRLKAADIVFEPGLNEDLAMTAVWGSQQLDFVPGRRVDGVFGMWYGKGPGVDRSGDAIKHANMCTHPNGGVLLVFGDDHAGKSSSLAHQSDLALAAHEVPILYPSDVHDIFKFALAGFAMSRECGLLAGLKLVNETADCTQAVKFSLDELSPVHEEKPTARNDVSIRVEMLAVTAQDQRMVRNKLPRVHAFTRRNGIDRVAFGAGAAFSSRYCDGRQGLSGRRRRTAAGRHRRRCRATAGRRRPESGADLSARS